MWRAAWVLGWAISIWFALSIVVNLVNDSYSNVFFGLLFALVCILAGAGLIKLSRKRLREQRRPSGSSDAHTPLP